MVRYTALDPYGVASYTRPEELISPSVRTYEIVYTADIAVYTHNKGPVKCHVPKMGYTGILKYFYPAGTSARFT